MARTGLIIVYIGDGKGKTTAAVGLAVRAAGTGMKVAFTQFAKGEWPSGELETLRKIGNVEVKVFGKGFVGILGDDKPKEDHIREAERALAFATKQIESGDYDLIVLDEAISAIEQGLLSEADILNFFDRLPERTHLCLTGHSRFEKIIDRADLVTEMKMIKHPYYEGMLAQRGIDY